MQKGDLSHFRTLSLRNSGICRDKKTKYADQLQNLTNEFSTRFKDFGSHEHLLEIFSSPFHTDVTKAPADIQMELIDRQANTALKAKYKDMFIFEIFIVRISTKTSFHFCENLWHQKWPCLVQRMSANNFSRN